MRFSRWTQNRVFNRIYAVLSEAGSQHITAYALDAPSVNVHPDAFGCLQKTANRHRKVAWGLTYPNSCAWRKRYAHKKLYLVQRGRNRMHWQGVFSLKRLASRTVAFRCLWTGPMRISRRVLGRGACALRLFVRPQSNATYQGEYDKEVYKRRNGIERFVCGLKAFGAVFTGYDKCDVIFSFFVLFAAIIILLTCVNTP